MKIGRCSWAAAAISVFVLIGCAATSVGAEEALAVVDARRLASSDDPHTADVLKEITDYYRDMSCRDGKMIRQFETHFWRGATITTICNPREARNLR